MKGYVPQPIDTSKVIVSDEIKEIAEFLAKNTHEVWSKGKMEEGWIHGDVLDYDLKTHPDLIPYEQLSEAKKDYDRRTSLETLKVILNERYRIVKTEESI